MVSGLVFGQTPPPQAVAAGFTSLNFDQEPGQSWDIGYGTDGHKWNANTWWKSVPSSSNYSNADGVETITDLNDPNSYGTDLCTQDHDYSTGTYFQGGYFEAYLNCTDWSQFWLFCALAPYHPQYTVASNPLTYNNEIDIIETDPGTAYTNNVTTTIHYNTNGYGGVPDQINLNNVNSISNGPVCGKWHTYGVLWTQSQVTWYVDNVQVCTAPTFDSTWQPAQLILTAQPGGVAGSQSTVNPAITQVQWVRVWETPGYVNPTPSPNSTPAPAPAGAPTPSVPQYLRFSLLTWGNTREGIR